MARFLPWLAALAPALACSSSATEEPDAAPLVQVDEVACSAGSCEVAMLAHGASPPRGLHAMQLLVTNTADGTMMDGLALDVVPWMPAMGHGTELAPTVTPLGSGVYEVSDLDLYMAGTWQLRTSFGTPTERAAPALEIE